VTFLRQRGARFLSILAIEELALYPREAEGEGRR